MRFSIRTKFLLIITLLLLVIFSGITTYQLRSNTKSLRHDLLERSQAFATLATQPIGNVFAIYKDTGTAKIEDQIDEFLKLDTNVTNITVVAIDGSTQFSRRPEAAPTVSPADAASFQPVIQYGSEGELNRIIYPYFESSGAHRYSVAYDISNQQIDAAVRQEAISVLVFGVGSLILTTGLTYVLINRLIIKPVREVSRQAGLVSAGNLEQEIVIQGHDEIAGLGESINKMAESLKASIAELKEVDKVKSEFMMITSHNLRTPLTIISGYLENMELFKDTEQLRLALVRIGASVKRLEVFAEDILTISRFELGESSMDREKIVVSEFLTKISTEFAPTAALKGLTFQTDMPAITANVLISKPHIRSAVWNILDNAAKFTPKGGTISLKLMETNNEVQISVTDTGIGISLAEQPKLFTKFHRGTSTLVYDFEGTGIGLYASKVMVEKLGGNIKFVSEEGKGSTFTISLPVVSAEQKTAIQVENR